MTAISETFDCWLILSYSTIVNPTVVFTPQFPGVSQRVTTFLVANVEPSLLCRARLALCCRQKSVVLARKRRRVLAAAWISQSHLVSLLTWLVFRLPLTHDTDLTHWQWDLFEVWHLVRCERSGREETSWDIRSSLCRWWVLTIMLVLCVVLCQSVPVFCVLRSRTSRCVSERAQPCLLLVF